MTIHETAYREKGHWLKIGFQGVKLIITKHDQWQKSILKSKELIMMVALVAKYSLI